MTERHSEGPWSVTAECYVDDADGANVCKTRRSHPKQAANARLISAAPELLGALIQVRARLAPLLLVLDEATTLDRVNAAIAKAIA